MSHLEEMSGKPSKTETDRRMTREDRKQKRVVSLEGGVEADSAVQWLSDREGGRGQFVRGSV